MTANPCPVCDRKDQYRSLCEIAPGRWIWSCACGLRLISPMPTEDEIKGIYDEDYYDFSRRGNEPESVFNMKLKTSRWLLNRADRFVTPSERKRHLDIGCAFGYMIEAARRAGYRSHGLEISPAADEAHGLGYDVLRVTLEESHFPGESFDLITAVDVIEHIPEPRRWLEESRRILTKSGVLLLVTPDCLSLTARLQGPRWPHYKTEHLYYYSSRTLTLMLTSLGFQVAAVKRGLRYLTLDYIASHYQKYRPRSFEARMLGALRTVSPSWLCFYPLPLLSELVVIARKS